MDYGAVCDQLEPHGKPTSVEDIPTTLSSPYHYGYTVQCSGYPPMSNPMPVSGVPSPFGYPGFANNCTPSDSMDTARDQIDYSRVYPTWYNQISELKQGSSSCLPRVTSWQTPSTNTPQSTLNTSQTFPSECHTANSLSSTFVPPGVATTNSTPTGRVRKRPLQPGKPPYSYISLICMALQNSQGRQATLKEIINYIERKFLFYQSYTKWHDTIRHSLSINDCFTKIARHPGAKGCYWTIDPNFMDMFDNGSLLRRKYRFKKGSAKWLKTQGNSQKQHDQKTTPSVTDAWASGDLTPSCVLNHEMPSPQDTAQT